MTKTAEKPVSRGIFPALAAGGILGVDAVGFCVAMATLVFASTLSEGLAVGTAVFLLSTFVIVFTLQMFSGIRGALGMVQDTSISILAPAVAVAVIGVEGSVTAKFMTALAVLGTSTLATGLVFLCVGGFRLGRIMRVLPYPVAAGFLASSGWLLFYASVLVSTGADNAAQVFERASDAGVLTSLLLAIGLALVLLVTLHIRPGVNAVLVVLLVAIVSFYAVCAAMGISQDVARDMGFLPSLPEAGKGVTLSLASFGLIDWLQVLVVAPTLMIVVIVNLVGMLLNTGGGELATQSEVDINKELQSTGAANLLIGLMGGIASYITAGSTAVATRLGAAPRYVGIGFSITVLIGFFLAREIVLSVPTFVAAGLLSFIGISMLVDWCWDTKKRMTNLDWLTIIGILLITITIGILQAVLAGLVFALVAFAISYARIPVIRKNVASGSRSSSVDRRVQDGEVLRENASRIQLYELQGYLFFGSVEDLIDAIRDRVQSSQSSNYVILDFSNVSGVDSATCAALEKLVVRTRPYHVSLHMSGVSEKSHNIMQSWGMELNDANGFRLWDDTDAAIEFCENTLLLDVATETGHSWDPSHAVESDWGGVSFAPLREQMERITLEKGEALISVGDSSQDIFFLETGRLGVFIAAEGDQKKRVRSMVDGAIIGELAFYLNLPRTADIIAELDSVVLKLSVTQIAKIAETDPSLHAALQTLLGKTLAEKVLRMNSFVSDS